MKNKEKLLPIALAATALILVVLISVFSLASASNEQDNSIIVTETHTTSNGSGQNTPTVHGEQMVWQYDDTGNGNPGNFNVYETNISNSSEAQIIANETNEWLPIIYHDRIMWNNWFGNFFNKSDQVCPPNIDNDSIMSDNWVNDSVEINNNDVMSDNWFNETVSNNWFNDTINDNFNINAFNTTLKGADFAAVPTSGKAPLSVSFIDKSTGSPTERKWSFGDGTSSTEENPIHVYNNPGQYTVILVDKNANGISTKTMFDYIAVS